ncbi:NADH dehydrogenase I chain F [Salmonella enterica]|nr:NADH dehydrogenase I chain F [Salmonella enterica]
MPANPAAGVRHAATVAVERENSARAGAWRRPAGDIETLEQLCRFLGPGKTFCAHAPGAVEPLQSAIKYFREEFEAGIKQPFSNTHLINGIQPNLLKERW